MRLATMFFCVFFFKGIGCLGDVLRQWGVRVFRIGTDSNPTWTLPLTVLWVRLLGLLTSVSQPVEWSVQPHLPPCVVVRIH